MNQYAAKAQSTAVSKLPKPFNLTYCIYKLNLQVNIATLNKLSQDTLQSN